jgi:hypothetical protein
MNVQPCSSLTACWGFHRERLAALHKVLTVFLLTVPPSLARCDSWSFVIR